MNLVEKIKQKASDFVGNHPFLIAGTTLYLGATLAVNTAYYAGSAAVEGIERAFGVSEVENTGRLMKIDNIRDHNGGSHTSATFKLQDGKEFVAYDAPVVTKGQFFPYNFDNLKTGKTYNFKTFGKFIPSIIEVEEMKK